MKPKKQIAIKKALLLALAAALGIMGACNGNGVGGGGEETGICPPGGTTETYYLRAEPFIMTMNDGSTIPMWGYAEDSDFEALDGELKSPGPELGINVCATTVNIRLDNNLPVPTSIVINGQVGAMTPVYDGGRVRSFTHETAPGNGAYVEYQFTNFKPGTFLYESGTHIQVQRQMGLYGAIWRNTAPNTAYSGAAQEADARLLYSEIDPDLHAAVAAGQFGAGLAMTSTIDYYPKYFRINEFEYDVSADGNVMMPPGLVGMRTVIRLLNAGLKPRTFMLAGSHFEVVADDGNPFTYPLDRYAIQIEAGTTKDIILNLPDDDFTVVLDRALGF